MLKKFMLGLAAISLSFSCVACSDSDSEDAKGFADLVEQIGDSVAKSLGCDTGIALCDQSGKLQSSIEGKDGCLAQAEAAATYIDSNEKAVDKAVTDYSAVEKWDNAAEGSCSAYNSAKLIKCIGEFTTVYDAIANCEGLTDKQQKSLSSLKGWNDALGAAAKKQGLTE